MEKDYKKMFQLAVIELEEGGYCPHIDSKDECDGMECSTCIKEHFIKKAQEVVILGE